MREEDGAGSTRGGGSPPERPTSTRKTSARPFPLGLIRCLGEWPAAGSGGSERKGLSAKASTSAELRARTAAEGVGKTLAAAVGPTAESVAVVVAGKRSTGLTAVALVDDEPEFDPRWSAEDEEALPLRLEELAEAGVELELELFVDLGLTPAFFAPAPLTFGEGLDNGAPSAPIDTLRGMADLGCVPLVPSPCFCPLGGPLRGLAGASPSAAWAVAGRMARGAMAGREPGTSTGGSEVFFVCLGTLEALVAWARYADSATALDGGGGVAVADAAAGEASDTSSRTR